MKLKNVALLIIFLVNSLLYGGDEKIDSNQFTKEELRLKYELLKKKNDDLVRRIQILEAMLRKSELNRYNTIVYRDFWEWSLEEQVKDASLILLKRISEDRDGITTEILKKGKGVLYSLNEIKEDESHRLEDFKRFGFEGEIIFHTMNPPMSIGGYPVKSGMVTVKQGIPLSKFKKLAKSYDGK